VELTYILIAAFIIVLPIVLTKLFSGKSRDTDKVLGSSAHVATPAPAPAGAVPIEDQVKGLIAQGRKIEAIKLVRETNRISLEAAKDSVEAIEQHGRSTLGEMGMMTTVRVAQELNKDVHKLVAKGQKIEAIQLVRERTGLGLKEAKEIVDRLG
jgi:ribosomal protein L7/L12